jgi:hypothetical protein
MNRRKRGRRVGGKTNIENKIEKGEVLKMDEDQATQKGRQLKSRRRKRHCEEWRRTKKKQRY